MSNGDCVTRRAFDVEAARRNLATALDPHVPSPHDYHANIACLDHLDVACDEIERLRARVAELEAENAGLLKDLEEPRNV